MKILMVRTSHDRLGNTGRKTGFWLEEFAAPYFVFRDVGVELTLASPKGGQPRDGWNFLHTLSAPAVFHRVMYQGEPLVKGKRVTGLTNGEEAAANLIQVVPFLVEGETQENRRHLRKGGRLGILRRSDGRVVTSQNPASSTAAAKALMELLAVRKAA